MSEIYSIEPIQVLTHLIDRQQWHLDARYPAAIRRPAVIAARQWIAGRAELEAEVERLRGYTESGLHLPGRPDAGWHLRIDGWRQLVLLLLALCAMVLSGFTLARRIG